MFILFSIITCLTTTYSYSFEVFIANASNNQNHNDSNSNSNYDNGNVLFFLLPFISSFFLLPPPPPFFFVFIPSLTPPPHLPVSLPLTHYSYQFPLPCASRPGPLTDSGSRVYVFVCRPLKLRYDREHSQPADLSKKQSRFSFTDNVRYAPPQKLCFSSSGNVHSNDYVKSEDCVVSLSHTLLDNADEREIVLGMKFSTAVVHRLRFPPTSFGIHSNVLLQIRSGNNFILFPRSCKIGCIMLEPVRAVLAVICVSRFQMSRRVAVWGRRPSRSLPQPHHRTHTRPS